MKRVFERLLIFGVLIFNISCNKDDLTKETQKGANTFSCKVNGNIFKPVRVSGLFSDPTILSVRNDVQQGFGIYAENQETSESIFLESPYLVKTGIYKLYADYPNRGVYCGTNDTPGSAVGEDCYTTNTVYTGELTITRCDTVKHIYSGTFYFTAGDANNSKTVNVTDGRFDVKE